MYARTSGTTGRPKDVPITASGMRRLRDAQRAFASTLYFGSSMFAGKLLGIGSAAVEGHRPSGRPYGSATGMVYEGMPGQALRAGAAWIAPGGFHMVLKRQLVAVQIETNQDPPENSCRPAADVLFRSVAEIYRSHTLAVVLTGMGQDGLRGCEVIREAGGQIIIQDEASSVVWGMPGSIARAGLADATLPLDRLAAEITRRVRVGRF